MSGDCESKSWWESVRVGEGGKSGVHSVQQFMVKIAMINRFDMKIIDFLKEMPGTDNCARILLSLPNYCSCCGRIN